MQVSWPPVHVLSGNGISDIRASMKALVGKDVGTLWTPCPTCMYSPKLQTAIVFEHTASAHDWALKHAIFIERGVGQD